MIICYGDINDSTGKGVVGEEEGQYREEVEPMAGTNSWGINDQGGE